MLEYPLKCFVNDDFRENFFKRVRGMTMIEMIETLGDDLISGVVEVRHE